MSQGASYRVVLTNGALADLHGIEKYIRERSPFNAPTAMEPIVEAIEGLEFMPRRGTIVQAGRPPRPEMRVYPVAPYLIY